MKDITSYQFFKKLTELSFVEEIWLYGSRARQDHQERSDIDLAIVAPTATAKEWYKVEEIIEKADTLLHIDCIHFDELMSDSVFRKEIIKDKQILYKRQ